MRKNRKCLNGDGSGCIHTDVVVEDVYSDDDERYAWFLLRLEVSWGVTREYVTRCFKVDLNRIGLVWEDEFDMVVSKTAKTDFSSFWNRARRFPTLKELVSLFEGHYYHRIPKH